MYISLLKFARVRIVATMYALAFLGSVVVGEVNSKTVLTFFLISAFTIHANSINDYIDRKIDEINLKDAADRPLVTKDISFKTFWVIHFLSGSFALILSLFYGTSVFILTIGVLIIDYIYSLKPFQISYRPILSPVLLSIAYVYFPFSLGYWSSNVNDEYPWIFSIGLFFGFVARLLLKDFRDVKGDRQYGKWTFLLRFGRKTTCALSAIFWFLAALIICIATGFSFGVLLPLVLGLFQVLLLLLVLSKTSRIDKQQHIIVLIAKSANIVILTLLAFFLCQRQISLSKLEIEMITGITGTSLLFINFFRYGISAFPSGLRMDREQFIKI